MSRGRVVWMGSLVTLCSGFESPEHQGPSVDETERDVERNLQRGSGYRT